MSTALHTVIEQCNILQEPTRRIEEFLIAHPNLYKVVLLVNHVFRAVSMAAFRLALPCSGPLGLAVCFAGSLFYRLTVETHCAYKFALPAFAGSIAITMATSCVSVVPLTAYVVYIVLTVNYDVNIKLK
jgi:hypothetical protein